MARQSPKEKTVRPLAISSIAVSGLKSIDSQQSIEVRPLTILAGANSSGKSSIMQSVLLLKQTLETSYDPGPLQINGSNVKFTSIDQIMFRGVGASQGSGFSVKIGFGTESIELTFVSQPSKGLDILQSIYEKKGYNQAVFQLGMQEADIVSYASPVIDELTKAGLVSSESPKGSLVRERCFLRGVVESEMKFGKAKHWVPIYTTDTEAYSKCIQDIIHLPGLRGKPERAYPQAATGPQFQGTFDDYTASVVSHWSNESPELLELLGADLQTLGLTWKVEAKKLDDTRFELRVGRMRKPQPGGAQDLVNIADVGFGVSQTLPVLVALLAAQPGQLVYIEQPEIHLHPRAQVALAVPLVNAANRGVRVIVETHSALLILGVQTQVVEQKLDPNTVKLHWFTRDEETGATTVSSADLDAAGRFGDWPEDFDDVSLKSQAHYLDVAEALLVRP